MEQHDSLNFESIWEDEIGKRCVKDYCREDRSSRSILELLELASKQVIL